MKGKRRANPAKPKPFQVLRQDGEWHVLTGKSTGTRHYAPREISLIAPALLRADGSVVGLGVVTRLGTTVVITA